MSIVFRYHPRKERRRHDSFHQKRERTGPKESYRPLRIRERDERRGADHRLEHIEPKQSRVLVDKIREKGQEENGRRAYGEKWQGGHTTMMSIAIALNTNDEKRRSGTRKMRNFAIVDSMNAIAPRVMSVLMKKAKTPNKSASVESSAGKPHGIKTFTNTAMNIRSLFAAAHSISARRLPEYSRIIASWTMVSSRCVAGLSTG